MTQEHDENERLRRENAELREKLAHATSEAEMYRLTVREWVLDTIECEPPTDAEIQQMLNGPHGRSPLEMLEEFERQYVQARE
jgi:regulator of replication initiation timing